MIDSSHFHLEYPNRLLLASWLRAKRRRKFYWIKVCHDGSLPARYVRMSDGEKDRVAKAVMAVDELIVTSPALVDFFRVEFDMAANFISPLLPTAIPSHKTNTIPARNIITSVGAFIPEYGFDHLATAVERLRVEGRGISLTLIDGAFIRDDAYRDSVLRDRPWITVHEGVPRSTVGDLIAGSAAFVRPVEHESYGLSRVEAILANVPVIATNVGETRGMLTYEFGDIGALTTLIGKALIDHSDNELARWAEIYEQEATQNLATYLSVITGEPDA
jgi:glycosyltransferase involved in cell wall biosynthesis